MPFTQSVQYNEKNDVIILTVRNAAPSTALYRCTYEIVFGLRAGGQSYGADII